MKLSHPEVKRGTSKVTFSLWTEAQKSKLEALAACAHSSRVSVQGLKTQHKSDKCVHKSNLGAHIAQQAFH